MRNGGFVPLAQNWCVVIQFRRLVSSVVWIWIGDCIEGICEGAGRFLSAVTCVKIVHYAHFQSVQFIPQVSTHVVWGLFQWCAVHLRYQLLCIYKVQE
jgi:hypothetical protein